jgi:hypothetical protein
VLVAAMQAVEIADRYHAAPDCLRRIVEPPGAMEPCHVRVILLIGRV